MERQKSILRSGREYAAFYIVAAVIIILSVAGIYYFIYSKQLSAIKLDTQQIVEEIESSLKRSEATLARGGKIENSVKLQQLSVEDIERFEKQYTNSKDTYISIKDNNSEIWQHNGLKINPYLPSDSEDFRDFVTFRNSDGNKLKVYRVYQVSEKQKNYHYDVMRSWTPYYDSLVFSGIALVLLVGLVVPSVVLTKINNTKKRTNKYDKILKLLIDRAEAFTKDAPNWPDNPKIAAHDIKAHIGNLLDSVESICENALPDRWEIVKKKFEKVENDIDKFFSKYWENIKRNDDEIPIDIVKWCKALLEPNNITGIIPVLKTISSRKEFGNREFPPNFLTLRYQGVPDSLYIRFNEDKFISVLNELLLNAARAAKARVVVTIKQDKQEDRIIQIIIENDGESFPINGRKGILLRGGMRYRKNMDNTSGGMGLPDARYIVCNYSGNLLLDDSDELGGARVVLEMPLVDEKTNISEMI